MHITELALENFKGIAATHKLAKATVITGPNFAGKTALLDAIRFAVCGKLPEIGNRANDAFAFASGSEMSAGITFDNGASISRRLRLTKGTVSATVTVDENSKAKFPEGLENTPLFNSGLYWTLKPRERVLYALERCPMPEDYSAAKIQAKLEGIQIADQTEDHIEARNKYRPLIAEVFAKHAQPMDALADLLAKETGLFTCEYTRLRRTVTDGAGCQRTLAELQAHANDCDAGTMADYDTDMKALADSIAAASRSLGVLNERKRAADRSAARLADIRRELAGATDHAKDAEKLKSYDDEIARLKANPPAALDSEAKDKAWERMNKLTAVRVLAILRADSATAEASKLKQQIDSIEAMKECPTCHSSHEGWREGVLSTLKAAHKAAETAATVHSNDSKAPEKELAEVHGEIDRFDAIRSAHQKWESSLRTLLDSHRRLSAEIEGDVKRIEAMKQEAERLEGAAAFTEGEALSALEIRVRDEEEKWDAIAVKRDKALGLRSNLATAAEALLRHERASAELAVITAYGKAAKEMQTSAMEAGFKSLMGVANMIAGSVLRGPLCIHEGEIGYWREFGKDGGGIALFVGFSTFSGTEKAITEIAIAAALSAKAQAKIALLDELGRIDAENSHKVMGNLLAAVAAGVLDQVVVTDNRDVPFEGWARIAL